MKIKKEFVILAAVIVLLSLYLVFYNSDRTKYQLPAVPDIVKKDISKIELTAPKASIALSREDDAWTIGPEKYLADDKKMTRILDVIETFTLTDLVSESENYIRYELDEEKKIRVTAYEGGEPVIAFDIGKTAPSYRHTFTRLGKDPRVFYADGNFRSSFEQTIDSLRDKNVLSFDKNDIQSLSIVKGETALMLSKVQVPVEKPVKEEEKTNTPPETEPETEPEAEPETELVWQNGKGEKIEKSKIDRLLNALSKLACYSYPDGVKKEHLTEAIYTVTLKGTADHSLSLFSKLEKDASEYPGVSSQSKYVFALSASQSDNFMAIFDEQKE
jgi:hypothetical protein